MTQVTDRGLMLPTAQGRSSVLATCVLRGVMAAGLGLGALSVLVTVVWISSPYPDSGPGGALRAAASLWLLAHGAQLVRPDTLSGVPAPVGIVPLLLVGLPVWLAHRAARDVPAYGDEEEYGDGDGAEEDDDESEVLPPPWTAFAAVTGGYLLVGGAAVLYASDGPLPAAPLSAVLHLLLVVPGAVAAGLWTAYGRPRVPLPRWVPGAVGRVLAGRHVHTAVRAGSAGAAVLLAGGALLAGTALVWHISTAQDTFLRLAEDWPGRLAVVLLALALLPNAAVWGAAYGLGPGFLLGAGAAVTPLGVTGTPAVPHFPLLSALPEEPRGSWLTWSVAVLPVLGGVAVGWWTARRATGGEEAWRRGETALAALYGAVVCGAAFALLSALSGGPLGTARLAVLGPVWWRAGGAALGWTAGVGVPAALVMRWWWGRVPEGLEEAEGLQELEGLEAGPSVVPGELPVRAGLLGVRGLGERGGSGRGRSLLRALRWRRAEGGARWWGRLAWWRRSAGGGGEVVDRGEYEPYDFLPTGAAGAGAGAGAWHESGAREVRWAALREASGGLMPEIGAGVRVPSGGGAGVARDGGAGVAEPGVEVGRGGDAGVARPGVGAGTDEGAGWGPQGDGDGDGDGGSGEESAPH